MGKKDKVLKWFDDEIKRIKWTAYGAWGSNLGKGSKGLDETSKIQIEQLQKQRQQYLETGQ